MGCFKSSRCLVLTELWRLGRCLGAGLGLWFSDSKWKGKQVPFTSPFTTARTYTTGSTVMMESLSDRPYFLVVSFGGCLSFFTCNYDKKNTLDKNNLRKEGFVSAHSSRCNPSRWGELRQQGPEARKSHNHTCSRSAHGSHFIQSRIPSLGNGLTYN